MKLKIISLNLWNGGRLMPAVIDFLRAEAADIVCLQEVHDAHGDQVQPRQRSMDELRVLGYAYQDFARAFVLREAEGPVPMGNAILSKLPVIDSSVSAISDLELPEYQDIPEHWPHLPRIVQRVEIDANGQRLVVCNLHGPWDLDGDNLSQDRRQMISAILEATGTSKNAIVAGDSNAKNSNPVFKRLESQLKNVFEDVLTSTFNMRHKDNPGYATSAVDIMYVSPTIKVLSSACPDVDVSDHLPLIASLEIPEV